MLGGAVGVVQRYWMSPVIVVGLVGTVVVSGVLADIDLRTFRLPNRIVGPFAAATLLWVIVLGIVEQDGGRLAFAIGAGLLWAMVLFVLNLGGLVGMGDVKLVVPLGMIAGWLGAEALVVSIVVSVASSGVVGLLLLLLTRNRERPAEVPYGPFLALGLLVGMLF